MDLDPRVRRVDSTQLGQQSPPLQQLPDLTVGQLAAHFSLDRWGIRTRPAITRPTASTTAVDVLGGNPKRVFWLVVNRGTTDANLDILATATAGNGVLLAAGGGYCSMDVLEDSEAVQYSVSVVAASGTPQLWVYEVEAVGLPEG